MSFKIRHFSSNQNIIALLKFKLEAFLSVGVTTTNFQSYTTSFRCGQRAFLRKTH